MTDCPICDHPKIEAINAALASGRSPNLVRAQYRLEQQMLAVHLSHHRAVEKASVVLQARDHSLVKSLTTAIDEDISDECLCYWCRMSGYQRLLRAWAEANTQEKEAFAVKTREFDVPF